MPKNTNSLPLLSWELFSTLICFFPRYAQQCCNPNPPYLRRDGLRTAGEAGGPKDCARRAHGDEPGQGVSALEGEAPRGGNPGCTHARGIPATNLDYYANFEAEVQKLPKDKIYLLHCASGRRSGEATAIMRKLGYKAYNMGGFAAVRNAGFPTE